MDDELKKSPAERAGAEILQQPTKIIIGGREFNVAPPSTATLILVSQAVARLPQEKMNPDAVLEESLSIAKDCAVLGEIGAILLLGAKHLTETVKAPQIKEKRLLWGLIRVRREVAVETTVDRKAELTRWLLEEVTPAELQGGIANLLTRMQIGDFFGLTTFLVEINLLRPTKKVEN